MQNDLSLSVAYHLNFDNYIETMMKRYEIYIQTTIKDVRELVSKSEKKIVYAHFMMPHFPYLIDSTGVQLPFFRLKKQSITDKLAYISYLKYTNTVVLDLIHFIKKESVNPFVICLISDHGFRYSIDQPSNLTFSNLIALKWHQPVSAPKFQQNTLVNFMRIVHAYLSTTNMPFLEDKNFKEFDSLFD